MASLLQKLGLVAPSKKRSAGGVPKAIRNAQKDADKGVARAEAEKEYEEALALFKNPPKGDIATKARARQLAINAWTAAKKAGSKVPFDNSLKG